jgi:hypothetical protein
VQQGKPYNNHYCYPFVEVVVEHKQVVVDVVVVDSIVEVVVVDNNLVEVVVVDSIVVVVVVDCTCPFRLIDYRSSLGFEEEDQKEVDGTFKEIDYIGEEGKESLRKKIKIKKCWLVAACVVCSSSGHLTINESE